MATGSVVAELRSAVRLVLIAPRLPNCRAVAIWHRTPGHQPARSVLAVVYESVMVVNDAISVDMP